jgi:hypothetical protein
VAVLHVISEYCRCVGREATGEQSCGMRRDSQGLGFWAGGSVGCFKFSLQLRRISRECEKV